jgi:hypothetical protein
VRAVGELHLVRAGDGGALVDRLDLVVVEDALIDALDPVDLASTLSRSTGQLKSHLGTSQPKRRASARSSAKWAP